MGGPTIIDFSVKKEVRPSITLPKKEARTQANESKSTTSQQTPGPSSSGNFRKNVCLPSLYALIVFVTFKQLSAGPKMWQAAQLVVDTLQQKAVHLKYQPVVGPVQESFSLAYDESFGFFDYISESDWKYRQQLARTRQDHIGESAKDTSNPKSWYMNNYYPSFSCPGVLRVGRAPGSGPKYVCDPHMIPQIVEKRMKGDNETCLVYSVGNPYNYDFEDGLVNLLGNVCEIHVFHAGDMGMKKPNIRQHAWNIKSAHDAGEGKTLQETVNELGHAHRVIDIMKIGESICSVTSCAAW